MPNRKRAWEVQHLPEGRARTPACFVSSCILHLSFVDVNLRLFGVCSYADFAKQRSPRRKSKKRRELHRTRLERETPGACRSQRRPPRRSVGMRAVSRQDLCHARVSIVRLSQWSLRRARSCCTFVLFVQATSLFMCAPLALLLPLKLCE